MILKALLADDERVIVENLKSLLPWAEMGIEVVGLAKNGREALDMAEAHRPDLILCDIRMPVMDGLAFIEQTRRRDPDCEILLLTGYQEFEYARSALRNNVRDYILKPIHYEELTNAVRRAADDLRRKRLLRELEDKRWGRVRKLAYEKVLFDVLMGYASAVSGAVWEAEGEPPDTRGYVLFVVDLDHYAQQSVIWSESERKLWNFAARNVLADAVEEPGLRYAVVPMREGEWCVLFERKPEESSFDRELVKQRAAAMQRAVADNAKLDISVGVYPEFVPFAELSSAYKKVQRDLHLSPRRRAILAAGDVPVPADRARYPLWEAIESIATGLKRGNRQQAMAALDDFSGCLLAYSAPSIVRAEQMLHFLILHLLREMREIAMIPQQEEADVWSKLPHAVGARDLMAILRQLIDTGLEALQDKKPAELLMAGAKDYIDRRLDSDLGIEELADYLGISCSYFSLLFKTHFGETFVEYVTRRRMELARTLLRSTDKSVAQIAKLCGYAERRYFTKVFLKYAGMPPSEYRESMEGGMRHDHA